MANLDAVLASNRAATEELLAAAERSSIGWTTPSAPGKWSPAQVAEHIARSLEEGANAIGERPNNLPQAPALLRPVAAWLFKRILRTGKFPKARTTRAMNPEATPTWPASPAEARTRVSAGLATFESEARARAAKGDSFRHESFGVVKVEDYVRFTELHTRHHHRQIPS